VRAVPTAITDRDMLAGARVDRTVSIETAACRASAAGTRAGRRASGCFAQAVLVLRWCLDGTRMAQLAADNAMGTSTAYRYLHEGIDALAERPRPDQETRPWSTVR